MLFYADAMLKKLARWLRMLGFKVLDVSLQKDDDKIIKEAEENNAILLTKDEQLFQKAKNYLRCIMFKTNDLDQQLIAFFKEMEFDINEINEKEVPSGKICSICNGELKMLRRLSAKNLVPKKSFENATEFFQCKNCKKVYWDGSHNIKIIEKFKKIKKELNKLIEKH